ncbi:MAG TPA: DsrE/DsrF/DrsH-like family protein [Thermomicrobiales bacterium]|nr:DsrE/DsrF/DrsH-like family protein [Thermomicrobiales bacterium]
MDNGTADRMAIILFSGTVDKLNAAATIATGGVAMGLDVTLFLTNWGLMAFRKGDWKTNTKISAEFQEYGPAMQEAMAAKNAPSWMDTLVQAKELGTVNVVACGQTMDLFGMELGDLEEIVDDIAGVVGFIGDAQEAKITLFI